MHIDFVLTCVVVTSFGINFGCLDKVVWQISPNPNSLKKPPTFIVEHPHLVFNHKADKLSGSLTGMADKRHEPIAGTRVYHLC